ncbi:SprT-like domain-containing protein [Massilia sp. TSP1-1-2]|uniref:SprT-like domain-containing protein n=1 Tax=Massilia sp. TSP1-1-2 TaxID=2804649 RepID=UPI003CF3A5ED
MKQTAIVYAELQLVYDTFNVELFNDSLADCLFTLQRKPSTMGYFSAGRFGNRKGEQLHELAVNPDCFAVVPLVEIMSTIAHEMVHLWQHQHGTPGRGRYHDKVWGDKMEEIGLMPSSTGMPGGKKSGDKVAEYPIKGGRFLAICDRLLTADFQISWYDRFTTMAPYTGGAAGAGILADLPASGAVVASASGVQMAPSTRTNSGGVLTANKSNRSKYRCTCDIQVWGKPGLKIKCCACDEVLEEEA